MADRAATFAAVLGALLVGHTIGDHLVQTDHQAANKARNDHTDTCDTGCSVDHQPLSWRAMAGRVGYTAACAVTLAAVQAATGACPSWRRVVAGHAFSAATHALIDRRWPVKRLLQATRSPRFAELHTSIDGPYLADLLCTNARTAGGGMSGERARKALALFAAFSDVRLFCDQIVQSSTGAGTGRTTDHQPDLPTARALTDYRGSQGDHDSPTRWALDAIGQTTSHAQVNAWLADGTIDAETAAAYHAVLIASHDDLAAAAQPAPVRPAAVCLVITSGRGEQQ